MWVAHSHEVLAHTQQVLYKTTESGLQARDFMLTGNKNIPGEFKRTRNEIWKEIEVVNQLTNDNPAMRAVIDSASSYIFKRIRFSMRIIERTQTNGMQSAISLIQTREGDFYIDRSEYYIRLIDQKENKLLAIRIGESSQALIIMNISFLVTICFILALIFFQVRLSKKEALRRNLMVEELLDNDIRMNKAEKLASFGTWSMDLTNWTINASDEMYRIWGFDESKRNNTFDNFVQKVHPDDYKLIKEKLENFESQNGTENYTFRIIDEGGIKYISNGVTVTRDDQQALLSVTGYVQDITSETMAATQLKDANTELSLLFNRIGEVLFSRDMIENKLIQVSSTCKVLYGFSQKEFMADPNLWVNMIHPNDKHIIDDELETLSKGQVLVNEYRIIRKTKEIRWVENKITPTLDIIGTLVRIDGITSDITEKKTATLERKKIVADLIQRNNTLEQFTYIVSHNLRVPVANIIGLGKILDSTDNDPKEQQELITNMCLSAKGLDQIIKDLNQILEVRDQVNQKKEIVYFQDLVKDIEGHLKTPNNNVVIQYDFKQTDSLFTIRSYMYSIFHNIIQNSINFRRENVDSIINIKTSIKNNNLELVFTDNGKGIDLKKNMSTLFGLYRRYDDCVEGKGMGLFMVKTQVEALGGTINVKSKVHEWTEFCINLPLNEV
jgi:PAS domain S-box-containing protein